MTRPSRLIKHALENSMRKWLEFDGFSINKMPEVGSASSEEFRQAGRRNSLELSIGASNQEYLNTNDYKRSTKSIISVPPHGDFNRINNVGDNHIPNAQREPIEQLLQDQRPLSGKNVKIVYSVFVAPNRNIKWTPQKGKLSEYNFMQLLEELD
ncbi:hypothetical protein BGZ63DRAFT_409583 [Mariannaea sp. PMI_226]|nr:hypothetical protein BGZ63DRAFT_409583 [Mariannaea sp. PMI_226]